VSNAVLFEAARIRDLAISRYRPGILLVATFKQPNTQTMRKIRYLNPRDIPLAIEGDRFFLWSVRRAEHGDVKAVNTPFKRSTRGEGDE